MFSLKSTVTVFPGGQQRGNLRMTTNTVMAKRKGDPQHDVEGQKSECDKYEHIKKENSVFEEVDS